MASLALPCAKIHCHGLHSAHGTEIQMMALAEPLTVLLGKGNSQTFHLSGKTRFKKAKYYTNDQFKNELTTLNLLMTNELSY